MADTKISGLPPASALGGSEQIPMVQSGADVRSTPNAIKTFVSSSPSLTTPDLGTPSAGVLTNCTGTASGLTAGAVSTISGLVSAGTNVTITGSGTSGSPYSIASTGGGGMTYPGAGVPVSTGSAWGASISLGTNVQTALGNTLNAAGGLVGYSGALGTPASGTLTNCTIPATAVSSGYLAAARLLALTSQNVTASGSSLSIDMNSGWVVNLTLSATVTSFTVSNWPASGIEGRMHLIINSTGAYNITGFPGTTTAAGGVKPTVTSGNGKIDEWIIRSIDGGTNFKVDAIGANYS